MPKLEIENRELSWLDFNYRILSEAQNDDNPLLEQSKFLSIVSSNLDEFFMVRVGSLCRNIEEGSGKLDPAGMTYKEQLNAVWQEAHRQVDRQYYVLQRKLLPALAMEGIHFLSPGMLDKEQLKWLGEYFDEQVLPLLTPWAITAQRPFPLLTAKCLHIAVLLPPRMRSGGYRFALVSVPTSLSRVVLLPSGIGHKRGILLEDVICMHMSRLFNGLKPVAMAPFRLTRNADFLYNDHDAALLIAEMRKNLKRRKWGKVVRLEVPKGCDPRLLIRLRKYLCITEKETMHVPGPIDLTYFMKEVSGYEGFDHLRFDPFTPWIDEKYLQSGDIFEYIRSSDRLLHHPYDSFDPVVDFVCRAAEDPQVMAIKQTLYRVSGKSPIVAALAQAAQNGKQVTVLLEVRARFDEENNIKWCLELEKAGCHVYYGVADLKTHSKITLVVRKEDDGMRSYVHLGTGNYNDSTAKLYTDFGLFTADAVIGRDAGKFFNMVTGYGGEAVMDKLVTAPYQLRSTLADLIKYEIRNAREGLPALISAKMNSLCDPDMIRLLYRAADAGVQIRLLVRGICCIKKRKNIQIRSIVGRFLEHARIFIFHHGGDQTVYLSSADWMPRNLDKRVELMFPIEDADIKARIIATLRDEWRDNVKAWEKKKTGLYVRVRRGEPAINAQEERICGHAMIEDLSPVLDEDDLRSIDRKDRQDEDEVPDASEDPVTAAAAGGPEEDEILLPDDDPGEDEDFSLDTLGGDRDGSEDVESMFDAFRDDEDR